MPRGRAGAVAFLTSVLFSRGLMAQDVLSRARELAVGRRFEEAIALHDRILAKEPGRWDAEIGRGEALVWAGRYTEAEETYRRLERRDPGSVDVARGLARAAYWSGDFRHALPRFERVARLAPEDQEARQAIAALRSLMRPTATIGVTGGHDNQPATTAAVGASSTLGLDPQTFLDAELGGFQIDAVDAGGICRLVRARVGISAQIPRSRIRLAGSIGGLSVSGGNRPLAEIAAERRWGAWSASIGALRGVALDSAASYRSAIALEQLYAGVKRDEGRTTGAAELRGSWYGDGNAGFSGFGWGETTLLTGPSSRLAAGAALAYADSRESRTKPVFGGSTPLPSGVYSYDIRTVFDPYVTPERQLEVRLSLHATITTIRPEPRLRLDVSGEWGGGRERSTGYGPQTGYTPTPETIAGGTYSRTYTPWKAAVAAEWSGTSWTGRIALLRVSTAFYTTTSAGITVTRRL